MKTIIADTADYFDRDEISNSMMKYFQESGSWSYHHRHNLKTLADDFSSDALRIGTGFHNYVEFMATPGKDSKVSDYVVILPDFIDDEPLNLRKKAHRELVADWKELAGNVPCLTAEEMAHVTKMVASMWDNPAAHELVTAAQPDYCEVVCTNVLQGVAVKAKADLVLGDTIVDYKTTRHATKRSFLKYAVWKYKDHRQAAHYLDVFEAKKFIIIAVRSFEPYESIVYEVPSDLIAEGREANYQTLDAIKDCRDMDSWHSPGWGSVTHLLEDNKHG